MSIFLNQTITKIVNNKNVRNFAARISDHKALLPIIMLETSVIAGRTYQAYKRGGKTECRERIIDETLTAAVWFGVITWLNSAFGKLIKTKGIFDKKGLPEIDVDLGNDEISNPLKHALKKRPEIKNKICSLKLIKIFGAAVAGIYLSGVVLPKFYQNLTKKILNKEKLQKNAENKKSQEKITMQKFLDKTSNTQTARNLSFGNAATLIHSLENNAICKLLTVDAGLFASRAYNARNNDERFEFLFRDCSSSFFYMASTPLIYKGLSIWADKFKGKNTNLDPKTANYLTEIIKEKLKGEPMSIDEFKDTILGKNRDLATRIMHELQNDNITDIDRFKKVVNSMITDKKLAKESIERAEEFLRLRPVCASKTFLTMKEVLSSVIGGTINDPKILNRAIDTATGIADKKLSEQIKFKTTKFISLDEINKIKEHIVQYAQSIVEYAQKQGKTEITNDILTQVKNRNLICKVGYTFAGLAVSALFLSTIIPKLQYKLTEMRTGNKDFPGIRDIK